MEEYEDYYEAAEPTQAVQAEDETGARNTWEILTWIFIALTIILNLLLIAILIVRRNTNSIVNKSEKDRKIEIILIT